MRAWQYTTAHGGLEHNLFLPATGVAPPTMKPTQITIQVHSAALNPADYKVPELGLAARLLVPSPCTPGMDFCGCVTALGDAVDVAGSGAGAGLKVGTMVFGSAMGRYGAGSLGEMMVVEPEMCAALPEGVGTDEAASVGVAGLTAYQSIMPNVKSGDHVFVNGGSGGVGTMSIQIAKALGCRVTTSCSGANAELCRRLGAETVIDYKAVDLIATLTEGGLVFDLVVDNVGAPAGLYHAANYFLKPGGKFMQIGAAMSKGAAVQIAHNVLRPGFLGGGQRPFTFFAPKNSSEDLKRIGEWLQEGKVEAVLDSTWNFGEAPKAFQRLRTGRARGKVVVHVLKE